MTQNKKKRSKVHKPTNDEIYERALYKLQRLLIMRGFKRLSDLL